MKQFNLVVIGGTFDHFHKGHREFLNFVLSRSNNAVLGLTSNSYSQKKTFWESIEPFEKRKSSIEDFLKNNNNFSRVEIAPIDNLFIPQKWASLVIEAIIVSDDTRSGATQINQKRIEQGKPLLPIIIAPFFKGEDGAIISSTRIRNGEIDREGNLYIRKEWVQKDLLLPTKLRAKLKKPFGVVINDIAKVKNSDMRSISVGDISTKMLNSNKVYCAINIVDFFVERTRRFTNIEKLGFFGAERVISVKNKPGMISAELFRVLKLTIAQNENTRTIILIDGEEDLAVLACILLSPLGWRIFYGQPHKGIVMVEITEESKKKSYSLASRFTLSS